MNRTRFAFAFWFLTLLAYTPIFAQIDFWTRAGGPQGGEVAAFTETTQDLLFAGTPQGEIYRTADNGENWELAFSRLEGTLVFLATDEQNRLYAGANTFEYFGRLYRSEDLGATWSLIYEGPALTSVAFDPQGRIWATRGTNGIIQSINDGIDWQEKTKGIDPEAFLGDLAIGPDGQLFVTATVEFTFSGIYTSDNAGNGWDFVSFGDAVVHSVETIHSDNVVLVTSTQGLHRSTDGGNSWKLLLPFPAYDLVTHPDGQTFVLRWETGTEPSLYFSPSNGDQLIKTSFSGWPRALFLRHNQSLFLNSRDKDEVWRSTDNAQTLIRKQKGFAASHVMDILADESGALYALTRGGVFSSLDDGQSWTSSWLGLPQKGLPKKIFNHPSGILYLDIETNSGHRVFASFDGGESWGSTALNEQILSMATLGDQFAIARTPDGVYRTFDNWISSEFLTTDATDFQTGTDGRLYALQGTNLAVSNDLGTSWATLGSIIATTDASARPSLNDLLVTSDGNLFASAGFSTSNSGQIIDAGVYRSADGGQTWDIAIDGVFPQRILEDATGKLYINPDGILVSSDFGVTWTAQNDGLIFPDIYGINGIQPASFPALAITETGKIFTGSSGFGVFTGKAGTVTNLETITVTNSETMLLFPNPAVSEVQISFSNSWNGEVQLQLIDMLGQVVDQQVIQKVSRAITHSYVLPNAPTGQYWVRLQHRGGVMAHPLVIR